MDQEQQPSASNEQESSNVTPERASQVQTNKRMLSRRQFLILSAITTGVAGASLLIGVEVVGKRGNVGKSATTSFAPNIWVRIDADNTVTIQVARPEMGQGALTAFAMLLAEELDADWANVRVEQAVADEQYGDQRTTGSSSITEFFIPMRSAGAGARAFL